MNPELPSVEQDGMVSPHAREVEYALILSRMIDIVKGDPSQIRLAIYEFARARLKLDTSWADEAERKQLSAALETAIQGVEQFSVRQDEQQRLRPSAPSVQIGPGPLPTEAAPAAELAIRRVSSPPDDIPARRKTYWRAEELPVVQVQTRARVWRLARFSIGILLFGAVASLAILRAGLLSVLIVPSSVATPSNPEPSQQTSVKADVKTAAVSSTSLPFPLPSDYDMYALPNAELPNSNSFRNRRRISGSRSLHLSISPAAQLFRMEKRNSWCSAAISRATRLIELKFVWSPGWRVP
jgi:hypothetical protein